MVTTVVEPEVQAKVQAEVQTSVDATAALYERAMVLLYEYFKYDPQRDYEGLQYKMASVVFHMFGYCHRNIYFLEGAVEKLEALAREEARKQ